MMKKNILTAFVLIGIFSYIQAQVGVNQSDPKANLDIAKASTSSPDGLLIPRLSVAELNILNDNNNNNLNNVYGSDQHGTLVFVTDVTGAVGTTIDIKGTGFYFYDSAATPTPKWSSLTTGNYGNGSFTPKAIDIPVPTNRDPNWAIYLDYNYFNFVTGLGDEIIFPKATDFLNKTIYIRNSSGANIYYFNIPVELTNNGVVAGGTGGFNLDYITESSAQKYYSDGIRWYYMAGRP